MTISTQQTQGPNQNIILADGKQIELGMTTMGIALQAWEGSAPSAGSRSTLSNGCGRA